LQFGLHTRTQVLDGVTAFTTLSLFNTLRLPLVILPKCLRSVAEAASAVRRLQEYLLSPERVVEPSRSAAAALSASGSSAPSAPRAAAGTGVALITRVPAAEVVFEGASFTYPYLQGEALPLLRDVSIRIPRGKLAMVFGPVGSGQCCCTHPLEVHAGHQGV
jgi:ABC-type multidrug transport system fused ATPase/permease subunit